MAAGSPKRRGCRRGLRSDPFACARGGRACGAARAQAPGPAVPGTLRGPPAGGPHGTCFRVQTRRHAVGASGHATECKWLECPVSAGTRAERLAAAGRVRGGGAPSVQGGGFLRGPGRGGSPETCAWCPGLVGLLVGGKKQVPAAGGPLARRTHAGLPAHRPQRSVSPRGWTGLRGLVQGALSVPTSFLSAGPPPDVWAQRGARGVCPRDPATPGRRADRRRQAGRARRPQVALTRRRELARPG